MNNYSKPIRSILHATQLLEADAIDGQVDNFFFAACGTASGPPREFAISIQIPQTVMKCNQQGIDVNGKATDLFPAINLRLVGIDDDLVPLDRDLLRDPEGSSYWDVTLSPGKIWSEEADGPWSRAALPFQFSNIFENDTHHGIATFLYSETNISPIFFQIVAETKPFLIPDNLLAWGWLEGRVESLDPKGYRSELDVYQEEKRDWLPMKSLEIWRSDDTEAHMRDIEYGFGSDSSIVNGLVIDDVIYSTSCQTTMGDYPYPRSMKFGIWSATKTAFCTIACLRLAHIMGEDPRDYEIAALLPEAKSNEKWASITIGHCMDMATGIGTAASDKKEPNIFGDYLLESWQSQESEEAFRSYNHYHTWFLAPSQHEKNLAAFACPSYPWPASTIVRYRDQDLYVAGAALDALLKSFRGPDSRLWDMVRDEVYVPARIHHAVKFHTIESDHANEVPLTDAGMLLTMDNIAALGRLILAGGKRQDRQILEPQLLDSIFSFYEQKGLPTGIYTEYGEVHYYGATWHLPYQSSRGEKMWIPTMRGYGGQVIQVLPNRMTAFRFGFDSYDTDQRYDALKLVRLADAIKPF